MLGNTATEKSSYCKSTLDSHDDFSSHQQKCMEKPIKCPDCSHVVVLKDWYHHKCQNTGAKGISHANLCPAHEIPMGNKKNWSIFFLLYLYYFDEKESSPPILGYC